MLRISYSTAVNISNTVLASWPAVRTLYLQRMSFDWLTALPWNNWQRLLSVARKTCEETGNKQKLRWHSVTTAGDAVQKIFMNKRVKVNSRECLSRDNNEHASVAYNSVGKHLARSSSRMVSSDADRPILPYIYNTHCISKNVLTTTPFFTCTLILIYFAQTLQISTKFLVLFMRYKRLRNDICTLMLWTSLVTHIWPTLRHTLYTPSATMIRHAIGSARRPVTLFQVRGRNLATEISLWPGQSCGTVCQRQFVTRTVYTLLNADSNRTFLVCVLMTDSVMPFRSGFVHGGQALNSLLRLLLLLQFALIKASFSRIHAVSQTRHSLTALSSS